MSALIIIFLVALYGGMIIGGCCTWIIGHTLNKDGLARIGEIIAFIGLGLDAILLITDGMFGWMSILLEKI